MIIAFFGHARLWDSQELERKLYSVFDKLAVNEESELYFGGYGAFDSFAHKYAKKYYQNNKNVSFYFITPYITTGYQKSVLNHLKSDYDGIIYPEIESAPLRYAISYRNKWIAETADVIIAGIEHRYGGAYAACKHAERKGKKIINILSDIFMLCQ